MTGAEAERFSRKLLMPKLNGLEANKSLLFRVPIREMLQSFYFQPSAFDRGFYIWVFVQPMYVPRDSVVLTFGKRLCGSWELTKGSESEVATMIIRHIEGEGATWLSRLQSPTLFIQNIEDAKVVGSENAHLLQAIAYSYGIMGDAVNALRIVDKFFSVFAPTTDAPAWKHKLMSDMSSFRSLVVGEKSRMIETLVGWRRHTLECLGLLRFAAE